MYGLFIAAWLEVLGALNGEMSANLPVLGEAKEGAVARQQGGCPGKQCDL